LRDVIVMATNVKIKELLGKPIISDSGRKYGVVGDVEFITESGELMSVKIVESSAKGKGGDRKIPFSAVKSVGDFVVISEKDLE